MCVCVTLCEVLSLSLCVCVCVCVCVPRRNSPLSGCVAPCVQPHTPRAGGAASYAWLQANTRTTWDGVRTQRAVSTWYGGSRMECAICQALVCVCACLVHATYDSCPYQITLRRLRALCASRVMLLPVSTHCFVQPSMVLARGSNLPGSHLSTHWSG